MKKQKKNPLAEYNGYLAQACRRIVWHDTEGKKPPVPCYRLTLKTPHKPGVSCAELSASLNRNLFDIFPDIVLNDNDECNRRAYDRCEYTTWGCFTRTLWSKGILCVDLILPSEFSGFPDTTEEPFS